MIERIGVLGRWLVTCMLLSFPLLLVPGCATTPSVSTPTPRPTHTPTVEPDLYEAARLSMVYRQIESRGVSDEAVLEAMRTVPRHLFVPEEWVALAYADQPLPIGYGQTISQPYIVAWMTELLDLGEGGKVLEVGTGSGYQAAVLGQLGYQVYTVEIIQELADLSTQRLSDLGYGNVTVRQGDGYFGWEEHAPFDAIIVTCAPDHIPPPLVQQLKEGGNMVAPVGPPGGYQTMFIVTKDEGQVRSRNLGYVRFVPLTR